MNEPQPDAERLTRDGWRTEIIELAPGVRGRTGQSRAS